MILSPSKGFLFVHIHKCAGQSIEKACGPQLGRNDILLGADADLDAVKTGQAMISAATGLKKHSGAADIRNCIGATLFNRLFRFAVVRSPHERAYSLYKYVIKNILKSPEFQEYMAPVDLDVTVWSDVIESFWGRAGIRVTDAEAIVSAETYPAALSFMNKRKFKWAATKGVLSTKDFDSCIRSPLFQSDAGFKPQVQKLCDPDTKDLLIPNLIKIEDLSREWPSLCNKIGITADLPVDNVSKDPTKSPLSEAAISFLKVRFAEDYALLGY